MATCGQRLLIAEDEPLLRVSMADALRKEGWVVDVAADGVKALALFEQYVHDVVITDLVMPSLDGMGLLRKVRQLQPDATVVLITAHGSVDKAVEAMRQGASDFVTKPFSMAQLLVRLEAVCSHRQLQQQNVRLQEELEGRYSFSNIIGGPIDMGLSPITAGMVQYRNMTNVDDSPGVRVFYAVPGYVWLFALHLGASALRTTSGLIELLPDGFQDDRLRELPTDEHLVVAGALGCTEAAVVAAGLATHLGNRRSALPAHHRAREEMSREVPLAAALVA